MNDIPAVEEDFYVLLLSLWSHTTVDSDREIQWEWKNVNMMTILGTSGELFLQILPRFLAFLNPLFSLPRCSEP